MTAIATTPDASLLTLSPPRRALPASACDCHAHVFGPFDRFPLQPVRSYEPPLAPLPAYRDMLGRMGFDRSVVVHPSAYGTDLRCTLAAIASAPDVTRGVGVVDADVTDEALETARNGGFRAMRFTEAAPAGSSQRFAGASGFAELIATGAALRAHGLHAEIFAPLDVFAEAASELLPLGVPLVLDHMGKFGPGDRTVEDPNFRLVLRHLAEGRLWVKMTAFRNSALKPDYPDVRPFAEALLRTAPDRLVWGTDWPLINSGGQPPDIGRLIDLFDDWLDGDDDLRRRIYVENPAVLYGF